MGQIIFTPNQVKLVADTVLLTHYRTILFWFTWIINFWEECKLFSIFFL